MIITKFISKFGYKLYQFEGEIQFVIDFVSVKIMWIFLSDAFSKCICLK